MDFHSIILDNRLLSRVHDLCNKYGKNKNIEEKEVKTLVSNLVETVAIVEENNDDASGDVVLPSELEEVSERSEPSCCTEEEITEGENIEINLDNDEVDLDVEELVSEEQLNSDIEEFLPSENYHFYYKLESTGNTIDTKPEYLEFKFDNGLSEYIPLSPPKIDKKNAFEEKTLYITIYDYEAVMILRKILGDAELHSNTPCVDIQSLYWSINDLRIKYKEPEYHKESLKRILDFTEEMFQDRYETMDRMIEADGVTFDSLWYVFDKIGTLYSIEKYDEQICVSHKSFCYGEDAAGERNRLELYSNVITFYSGKTRKEEVTYQIKAFTGPKEIKEFKIKQITDEQKEEFRIQAENVIKLAKGYHHVYLKGCTYTKHHDDMIKRELNERIIIDQEGCKKFGTKLNVFLGITDIEEEEIKEEEKCTIFPFLQTYNLGIDKTWGVAHIKYISDIEYQEDAFDHLVLDDSKKDIIQALVTNRTIEYKDFISDKGNNTVILLSGTPGVGKSLTAEATAEYLKLPLYRINVGDLGTNPEHMESILNSIFKLTERWNAIILIDEVDIFVEARSDYNIVHNAMVCTFMKILDFNSCIIFLTTNRLDSIDPAVKSRINLLLFYEELDKKNRIDIWKGLLNRWNIELSKETILELGSKKINGREIRNYIKSVISIHKHKKIDITDKSMLKIFENIYKMTTEFDKKTAKSLYA